MNADRESTKLDPEGGDGEPRATSGERPAAVEGSHDAKAEPTPFRMMAPAAPEEDEWEEAMLRVSTGERRLSIEMALVGFFGFPILAVILSFLSLAFLSPGSPALLFVAGTLALIFAVLVKKGKFALALGGIAGIAALAILALYLLARCLAF